MSTRVMVVDDSDFVRDRMSKLLEAAGYETLSARNGREAVKLYHEKRADVIFMDITMPGVDGLEALTEIRSFDPKAKVIMLTAIDQKMMITRAIHLGAKDYLTKPVSSNQLISALEKVLRQSSAPH